MSYCINPKCPERQNPDDLEHCQACGTQLLIKEQYRVVKPLRPLNERRHTEVFEVDDGSTPKVLKVLKSRKWVHLFEREARTLQRLKHPGIPKVEPDGYFIFTPCNGPEELHCLVMEKIEGQNLDQWLEKHGSISQELALKWLRQLAEILDRVHQNELFHRDIKLSNIMLRPDGQLVLIDFGTVREVTDTYLAKVGGGREITAVVSPGYTPLEQVNGKAVPQSDFYALGRTFVYLLTGKHPIEFPEDAQTGKLTWQDSAPQVSKPLADLIDNLMAPFPGRRPQNTQVILQRLANIEDTWHRPEASWPPPRVVRLALKLSLGVLTAGLVWLWEPGAQRRTEATNPCSVSVSQAKGLLSLQYKDDVNAIAFSPDGQYLAVASLDNTAGGWNLKEKVLSSCPPLNLRHSNNVVAIAFSPKGKYLATASLDNTVQLSVVKTPSLNKRLQHSAGVVDVAFSPDEKYLATASADGTAQVWETATAKKVGSPLPHDAFVRAVAFSPDGKYLATASLDNIARVWEVTSDRPVTLPLKHTLKHEGSVVAVSFSPNGKYLATASEDGTARVWETKSGRAVTPFLKHEGSVVAVAFSPNGKYLATASEDTASEDGTARVWETKSGRAVTPFLKHEGSVVAVAFSPNGKYLATASLDNTARVWEVTSDRPATLPLKHTLKHEGGVVAVAFSPDDKYLATASWDNMARVWNLTGIGSTRNLTPKD